MTQESGQSFLTPFFQTPPKTDEIEITVFGKGFGECIVLSCGHNEFIVIDSFVNDDTKNAIAIDYMAWIGLPVSSIKRVVLTHWHQDHIAGISQILNQADKDVKLVLSPIIKKEKFNEYMALGFKGNNPSTREFKNVYDFLLKNRGENLVLAGEHTRAYSNERLDNAEVFTLSPRDADVFNYLQSIIMPPENLKTSYSFPEDNLLSIVMLMKYGDDGFLFGSDMETKSNTNMGWKAIAKNYEHSRTRPSVFKVPHHGSENGHCDDVWNEILKEFPISILTVYNKGHKLPKDEDVERIKNLSSNLYVVGEKSKKAKEIISKARKVLNDVNISVIPTDIGIVRYRKNMKTREYTVEHFGTVSVFNNEKLKVESLC